MSDTQEADPQELNVKFPGSKSSGYDLYPERKGTFTPSVSKVLTGKEGTESLDKMKCERRILKVIERSPMVRLMMGALKSAGCPIDISRHLACEVCDTTVSGGYDTESNQIVVCQNMCKTEGMIQAVLSHEMIHMFDHCKHNMDLKNLEHLACTEIRAANLTHCSFMSAWSQGDADLTRIRKTHQDCVKTKALYSILSVRQISHKEAFDVIEKVFPKCYADLEPIGRRVRRNSRDMEKAYVEGYLYGYDL